MRSDIAVSYELIDIDPVDRPAFINEMERRIDMGSVMGAHVNGSQIAHLAFADAQHDLPLGRRISGIDSAAEYFL